jgi:DNA mismatch repair protein MutL
MTIRILSDETIDKIAAGEVVERPANAVKELAENALDAASTRIDIELLGAGRKLIRISDDGTGMGPEDLSLAVTRHATSKIGNFSDIDHLSTLGFRGEALPSIAAVSHLTLHSQERRASSGWTLKLSGGAVQENTAWAGAPGTIVEVTDLFYNTPARAKFLKSETTERHRALRIIEELALAHPGVSFRVTSEGRTVLNAPRVDTLRERIIDVLGADLAATLLPAAAEHPAVRISAYITRTENSLPTRDCQYLFINRRPVNLGKLLTHSLYEAYRENLPKGRHPGAVIFIDIPAAEVDVNVHPTKREVRFAREPEIHDLVYRTLKDALRNSPLTVSPPAAGPEPVPANGAAGLPQTADIPYAAPRDTPARSGIVAEAPRSYAAPAAPRAAMPSQADFAALLGSGGDDIRPLDQVFGLYCVVQKGTELLIIDQHAAAERVRYEGYRAQWEKRKIAVQGLLLPVTMELPASQAGLLRENLPLLRDAGWDIAEFGTNTLRVTGFPAVLGARAGIQDILGDIIEALARETKLPPAEKIESIIRAACRASIKAGEPITPVEAARLAQDLFRCHSPYTCPHGRPTLFKISLRELQKYFGR